MIWASFSANGNSTLSFVEKRINSIGYQSILQKHLLPFLKSFRAANHTFMQDDASVHASTSTKN